MPRIGGIINVDVIQRTVSQGAACQATGDRSTGSVIHHFFVGVPVFICDAGDQITVVQIIVVIGSIGVILAKSKTA